MDQTPEAGTPENGVRQAPTGAGDGTGTTESGTPTGTLPRGTEHVHHPAAPATEEIRRRLRSVEGHVRGVNRMVEEGAYCIDVVNQILAVERALKKVSGLVLDRHLHTCATTALRSESLEERERVIGEILDVFEAAGKA